MRFQAREQACEIREDGTLAFTWSGIVDPADVSALFHQLRERLAGPKRNVLWDMTGLQLLPGETRRRLLDELLELRPTATAVVASEFFVRVPVTMLLEVVATEIAPKPEYGFFETESEATAWLSDRAREVVAP